MAVQIWACVDDPSGVPRLVSDPGIECKWSNRTFLELRVLSM